MDKKFLAKSVSTVLLLSFIAWFLAIGLFSITHESKIKSALNGSSVNSMGKVGLAAGGGLQYLSGAERESYFKYLSDLGIDWVRFDFAWSNIQSENAEEYDWVKYDSVVDEANKNGIRVLGLIAYTPRWARATDCIDDDKCAPEDSSTYAKFVGETVSRYKNKGVDHWEIWNEPNNKNFWKPSPDSEKYSNLLKLSYVQAKTSNEDAFIISGGLSPAAPDEGNITPIDFISDMYKNGAKDYFDAFGMHPYCYGGSFDCPNEYAEWSAWSQMSETPANIRSVMTEHNDNSKKIWATEFGAPTKAENSVTEKHQAHLLTDAYNVFHKEEWAGPLFWYSLKDVGQNKDDTEDWFGIMDSDNNPKPAYESFKNLK